jgi:hypothetical protein
MPASLRPLSTGELLDKTFTLYRQNFLLFFGIAALPQVALFVLVSIMTELMLAAQRTRSVGVSRVGLALVIVVLFYWIGAVIAAGITQAATTFAVSSLHLQEATGIKAAYARVKGLVGRTINVLLSVGLRVVFGFMLFIIPGIIMLRRYSLSVPVAVLERVKAKDALKRSRHLSEGAGSRVLLVYVLMLVLIWGLSAGMAWLLGLAFSTQVLQENFAARIMKQLLSFLLGAAVGPVMTIAFTLLYYDQRVRKEAFDLEHMMNALQGKTAESSTAASAGSAI